MVSEPWNLGELLVFLEALLFGISSWAVLLEDAAAVLGVVLAFIALVLAEITHQPYYETSRRISAGASR